MCKPHKHQGTSCLRSAKIGDRRKMQDKKLSGGELREHWEID